MNIFLNDYNDLCHERVLKKISEIKIKGTPGYGYDDYSLRAKEYIRRDLNRDVEIQFVGGGTMANIIAVTSNLMPYEGIISAKTGHINAHEAGSIEACGKKLETIDSDDGKLNPSLIENKIRDLTEEHTVLPKLIYLSQTTELGTVYTYKEIKEIYDLCLDYGIYLYIDGARMAVGLAASDIKVSQLPELCDIFTLGGTKNGAMYGEALVVVADDLMDGLRRYMKQRGAVMAKGFILGAQFEALFEDGLYYDLGQKAYESGRHLAKKLKEAGVKFYKKPESNQIFIIYPEAKIEKLRENSSFEVSNYNKDEKIIRFVTSYRSERSEIDDLVKHI